MTRKSKQTGGHNPLTHYERTKKFASSQYGTTTARLSTDSQLTFGDCCLSLTPAVDPVATPSGHVYSREAIVEYLVTKTNEIKEQKQEYQKYLASQQSQKEEEASQATSNAIVAFEEKQKATSTCSKKRKLDEEKNPLASTSYWLSEFQPEYEGEAPKPPPDRPVSPFSGNPLRLKDLHSLTLERSSDGKVLCAVSHKTITTQPVVALKEHVVLQDVYDSLVKESMICPITGRKLKKKHVLQLQKASSGFASSGSVVAKKYRPTIT